MEAEPTDRDPSRGRDGLDVDPFEATAFGDLTRIAADAFGTPMAAICVVDAQGGHLRAKFGMTGGDPAAESALATWALRHPTETLVVEDAAKVAQLQDAQFVNAVPRMRFYAAVPLKVSSGEAIGALCVMDPTPRHIDPDKLEQLKFLGDQVIQTLEERQRGSR